MRSRPTLTSFVLTAVLAVVVVACSDGTGPRADVAAVAGEYWAGRPSGSSVTVGTFTTTENGVTTDMLGGGSHIRLVLGETGSTSGTLVIPGTTQDDLAGTWTLAGGVVNLTLSADTFLRDMDFQAHDGRLQDERTFAGVTVHVVLQRVP
jgi:hypothetical protein